MSDSTKRKSQGLNQFLQAQAPVAAPTQAPMTATPTTVRRKTGSPRKAVEQAASGTRRRTKAGKEQLLVYLQAEGIKQIKLAAIQLGYANTSAVVTEAINEWLTKRKLPPVA